MTDLSKEFIENELAKHNVKPNPKKDLNVVETASLPKASVPEVAEQKEMESKIKQLQKQATFSMKLNGDQIAILERLALPLNLSWKEAFKKEILEKVLGQAVSEPRIDLPSWAVPVTGPSNWRAK